jgi:hypothetical protein
LRISNSTGKAQKNNKERFWKENAFDNKHGAKFSLIATIFNKKNYTN